MAAAKACHPDVILMDVRMPNLDGIEAIKRLPHHRVLVLTTFGLDDYIVDALRAGASGFITKDVPAEELVRAVRVVAAGDALLTPGDHAPAARPGRAAAAGAGGAADRRSSRSSPSASARCSSCSPAGCPTPRSPPR